MKTILKIELRQTEIRALVDMLQLGKKALVREMPAMLAENPKALVLGIALALASEAILMDALLMAMRPTPADERSAEIHEMISDESREYLIDVLFPRIEASRARMAAAGEGKNPT